MTQDSVLPPHNIDAEKGFLGSVLISGDAYREIDCMLKRCDFDNKRYGHILAAQFTQRVGFEPAIWEKPNESKSRTEPGVDRYSIE